MRRAALVLVLCVAACSKSGGGGTTMAAYEAAATPICDAAQARIDAIPEPTSADLAGVKTFFASVRDVAKDELTKLRAVPRPKAEAARIGTLYDDIAAVVDMLDKGLANLASGNASAVANLSTDIDKQTQKVNDEFDALGLKACGSGSASSS